MRFRAMGLPITPRPINPILLDTIVFPPLTLSFDFRTGARPVRMTPMKTYTWDDIAEEQLNPLAGRKALHGTAITVAHFRFDKGNKVASHHHVNDQVTIVEKGAVRMVVGDEEFVLKAGQMVHVAPNIPHGNEALEDTVIMELFSPIREDWIR